jgi:hypothetical protein
MDTTKWKSVVVPVESYHALRALAKAEHRTISGQFTYVLESFSRRSQTDELEERE